MVSARSLVLASSSKPRQMLLQRLGLRFEVQAPDIDEMSHSGEDASGLVKRLAYEKACAVVENYPDALIIGSDQCACLDGVFIGKPGNHANARAQLNRVSGRVVNFHTGVCLLDPAQQRKWVENIGTEVRFRSLSEQEIFSYLVQEKPWSCAGSFRNERLGIALVERIRSDDPSALTGLPLVALCRMLRAAGRTIP